MINDNYEEDFCWALQCPAAVYCDLNAMSPHPHAHKKIDLREGEGGGFHRKSTIPSKLKIGIFELLRNILIYALDIIDAI